LRQAQRKAEEADAAVAASESRAAKLSDDKSALRELNSKLVSDLRDARRAAKDAHASSEGAAAAGEFHARDVREDGGGAREAA
jgi:hypothetical protein